MNKSPKLLMLIGSLCFLLIIAVIHSNGHDASQVQGKQTEQKNQIFDVASGDTNNETLRTIAARQESLEKENESLKKENTKIAKNEEAKRKKEQENLSKTFAQRLSKMKEDLLQSFKSSSNSRKSRNSSGEKKGYAVSGFEKTGGEARLIGDVADLSHGSDVASGISKSANDGGPKLPNKMSDHESWKTSNIGKVPFYTIPANSTLNNTSLMTSLIAEVPVSGRLIEPAFPFKAIIGKSDLFAANGISIPTDVAGMVIEGYSVGNMTLSCARGYITKVLFVFNDGHFSVYPDKQADQNTSELFPKNALGYLSDEYGNTCITGKYVTNAPAVITNLSLMDGVSSAGKGFAQMQTEAMQNAFQTSTKITGSVAKYIGGNFVAGAASSAKDWYKKRVDDIFDAVVIPATTKEEKNGAVKVTQVTFNVTKTIPIDLDKHGRTLRYENSLQKGVIANQLD